MNDLDYDLVVVGGGPAGATLATLVKKYHPKSKVLILEKTPFPRHHVGESMLSGLLPVLKEMGVFDAIESAGFMRKIGAVYVWGKDRKPWDADFQDLNIKLIEKFGKSFLDVEFPWQVLRSRYDEILLQHAQACGVEVKIGWRAARALEKEGRIVGLEAQDPEGRVHSLNSRILADCSGQNGFLSQARDTRRYRKDLKNLALYSYYKGAQWKFEYVGHPDKTKIFVCSVPGGWFWYIPLSKDMVSVGLVVPAESVRGRGDKDLRAFYEKNLARCRELSPLLKNAERLSGVDPREPARDFFTAGDWSFESGESCGDGWVAAGDAAFFIDPLLSSGVMMAHLSGHRAAYTISTAWADTDPELHRRLWADYRGFCRETADSYLALVRHWYYNDPHAKKWWKVAHEQVLKSSPFGGLDDKSAFVSVAAGWPYYLERIYTTSQGTFELDTHAGDTEEHAEAESLKRDLRPWMKENLGIVEPGFLKKARKRRPAAKRALDLRLVPRLTAESKVASTFLPVSGRLRPIARVEWSRKRKAPFAKRVLPRSYVSIVGLIDGRRSGERIVEELCSLHALPREVLARQVSGFLEDMRSLGILTLVRKKTAPRAAPRSLEMRLFRLAESGLEAGENLKAEKCADGAIAAGLRAPWAYALRGEARLRLGRGREALEDFDAALRDEDEAGPAAGPRHFKSLEARFSRGIEREWVREKLLLARARARFDLGEYAGALEDVALVVGADPRRSDAHLLGAKAAKALGDLPAAYAHLKAAQAHVMSAGGRS